VPTDSGETLLVRKDGDRVLFLNPLRHAGNAALKLSLPLSQGQAPAVMAEAVRSIRFFLNGQSLGPVTISLGVSAYPDNGETPEDLLRVADAALYAAKQAGRDRAVCATTL
jgi:GGDEF domain-containing protein